MKKYDVIYADPPWSYGDKKKGFRDPGAQKFYNTMKLSEILLLPIESLANKNAVLFLWVTNPLIPEGLKVMKQWGFSFKTVAFSWVKTTSKGKFVANLGRYTMGSTEICLLGTRGNMPPKSHSVRQLIIAERTIHSRKPTEVRDRIEILYKGNKIELFAREKVEGWDAWGNEIDNDIELFDQPNN